MIFLIDFADRFENCDRVGSLDRNIKYFREISGSFMQTAIISPDIKDYSFFLGDHTKHYPMPSYARFNMHIFYLLFSPLIFWNILKNSNVYWTKFSSAIPGIIAKKMFKKRLVNYFDYNWVELSKESKENKLEYKIKSIIEKLMIHNSDYFITTTSALKSYLVNSGFKYPENIIIIPNAVDTDLFHKKNTPQKGNIIKILSVGRLNVQKNFPLLIDGIAGLQNKVKRKIALTIVGTGPLKEAFKHQAQAYELDLRILDRINNNRMPEVYCEHDVFVMTSPREGHPRALIEAMSCGLPVIGTNVEGIKDIIEDGVNGLLCDCNPADVTRKVLSLANDEAYARRLGEKARVDVVNKYSFKALIQKEKDIYHKILNQ